MTTSSTEVHSLSLSPEASVAAPISSSVPGSKGEMTGRTMAHVSTASTAGSAPLSIHTRGLSTIIGYHLDTPQNPHPNLEVEKEKQAWAQFKQDFTKLPAGSVDLFAVGIDLADGKKN